MAPEWRKVAIQTENITLDQFLKWARLASTGGQAKMLIQDGMVLVNGEVETRRGRKLQPGDRVEVDGLTDGIVKLEVAGSGRSDP